MNAGDTGRCQRWCGTAAHLSGGAARANTPGYIELFIKDENDTNCGMMFFLLFLLLCSVHVSSAVKGLFIYLFIYLLFKLLEDHIHYQRFFQFCPGGGGRSRKKRGRGTKKILNMIFWHILNNLDMPLTTVEVFPGNLQYFY